MVRNVKMDEPVDRVVIFKKELLEYSATFVAAQPRHFTRYVPLFVGFFPRSSGLKLLEGYDYQHLAGDWPAVFWWRRLLHGAGFVPTSWARHLEAFRPVILHAQFGQSGVAVASLARALHIPLVVTFQGVDITARKDALYRWRRRRLYRQASAVIGVGRHLCERLRADGCPTEKIHAITTGVDSAFYGAEREPSPEPTLLFVGRLVAKKGIVDLLAVYERVLQERPEVRLEIAGDGPLRGLVEAAQQRWGEKLRFHGALPPDEVKKLYLKSWLLLAPGRPASDGNAEGLPTVLLEAQASGLAPVAYDTPGVNEAIAHGHSGRLVEAGNQEKFVCEVLALLAESDGRERLSQQARLHVQKNFEISRQSAKVEALYDQLREGFFKAKG